MRSKLRQQVAVPQFAEPCDLASPAPVIVVELGSNGRVSILLRRRLIWRQLRLRPCDDPSGCPGVYRNGKHRHM